MASSAGRAVSLSSSAGHSKPPHRNGVGGRHMKHFSLCAITAIVTLSGWTVHRGEFPGNAGSSILPIRHVDSVQAPGEEGGGVRLVISSTGLRLGADELREPLGLAVDARDFVYVADAMTGKVFRYSLEGESLEFETPSSATSLYPIDVAVQGSFVYVLDYADNRIIRYDTRGSYLDVLLSFREFERMHPTSLTVDESGRFITTDVENHTLTLWTPLMDIELTVGEFGWAEGSFNRPRKAVILPDGRIVVAEAGNRRLQILSPAGGYEMVPAPPTGKEFRTPRSVAVGRYGMIFVADTEGRRVLVFSAGGDFLTDVDSFNGGGISPAAIAVGWRDRLFVADLHTRSILVYRLHYNP